MITGPSGPEWPGAPDRRLHRFLRRFVDIRGNEARAALAVFLYFFLVMLSIYVVKPLKENFLIGVRPAWWGYADLITAGLIGFVVAFNTRLLNRLSRRLYSSATYGFFGLAFLLFWYIFQTYSESQGYTPIADPTAQGIISLQLAIVNSWPVPVFVFSFLVDVFIAMSVTQFWIAVNDVFNPHQAKRTIGFFVSGGLLGGVAGSLTTTLLVRVLSPDKLLLMCPAILAVIVATVNLVYAEQKKLRDPDEIDQVRAGARAGYLESLRTIRGSKYLRIMAGTVALAMAVETLVNFQFKIVVKDSFPEDAVRTAFLAKFFLAILLLSILFHWISTGRLLRRFGVRLAPLIAPGALLIGSLVLFGLPVSAGLLTWAYLLRGADKTFDNTLSQSLRELMFIPVPSEIKYKAKIFIDMVVNKLGTGLGAVIYMVVYAVSDLALKPVMTQVRELGVIVIGLIAVWTVLNMIIHREYLGVVKKDLARKWQDGHKVVAEHIDLDSTRLVFDTIQSRDRSSALYAMNMFQLIRKDKLTPELAAVIGMKEDEIKARSMGALLDVGGEVFYQGLEDTMADKDFEVQVREILALDAYKAVMHGHLDAVVGDAGQPETERMEAAKLMGLMDPSDDVIRYLGRLLKDPSPDVLNYALASAAVHLRKEHIPLIIRHLGNPMTQQMAQDSLASYGAGIEEPLRKLLRDPHQRAVVRRAVPEVLGRLGSQKAADILTSELAHDDAGMDRDIVDALYRIRADRPGIRFRERHIHAAVQAQLRKAAAAVMGQAGGAGKRSGDGGRGPEAQLGMTIKLIFDLLTLVYPAEDIIKAYQNIQQGTRKSVDYSLELLDNLLARDLKAILFPLVEDLPLDEKARRLSKALRGGTPARPWRRLKSRRPVV